MFATAGSLLILPLIAMQFTKEINWSPFDFLIAGILLFGTAALLEVAMRITKQRLMRIALAAVIIIVTILLWVEMAVGIFGSPIAGS